MKRYGRDPYWTTARYGGTCAKCGAEIRCGQQIFYYPNGRRVLCSGIGVVEGCGDAAAREFYVAAADEAMMCGESY